MKIFLVLVNYVFTWLNMHKFKLGNILFKRYSYLNEVCHLNKSVWLSTPSHNFIVISWLYNWNKHLFLRKLFANGWFKLFFVNRNIALSIIVMIKWLYNVKLNLTMSNVNSVTRQLRFQICNSEKPNIESYKHQCNDQTLFHVIHS